MASVRKAIIPAAGYGTRFLPATKSMPKEMLPIVDTPSIELIVEECLHSGITDICIILGRNKNSICDHFDVNFEVRQKLIEKDTDESKALVKLMDKFKGVNICYVRQSEMLGTAKAVAQCEFFAAGEPVAVLFGDDVMYNPTNPVIGQLIKAYENTGKTIVGVQEMPREEVYKYGVVVPGQQKGRYVELLGFKEKPRIAEAPSTMTSLGRYVLAPDIFDFIRETPVSPSGEYYLPTAIEMQAKVVGAYAYLFDGRRYDIGDKLGYVIANVEYALRNPALKEGLESYLRQLVKTF